jgi:putative ABC transport system permease protein
MIKTNLKLALRNIFRNKLYSAINIIGLGVASAFCILVYLYVNNERSFDNFHHDSSHLFRVEVTNVFSDLGGVNAAPKKGFFSFLTNDADQQNMIQTPAVLSRDLKRNFPEVEHAIRIRSVYSPIIRIGDQSFKETDKNAAFVDPDFFQTLDLPLVQGNKATVLTAKNSVVLSERYAKKYFGNVNPIGKTLNITSENLLLTVTGIAKNFPENSSLNYDIIIPREADGNFQNEINSGINNFNDITLLRLAPNTNVAAFQKKLGPFAKQYFQKVVDEMIKANPKDKIAQMHIYLRPFADAHYSPISGWGHYTDLKNIYQLVCLTIVILLIACLNYILLTLTSAISRSQDVGVRKTIGAGRLQIVLQYYTETQLLALISVIAGFVVAFACLPFFNSLTGATLTMGSFSAGSIAVMMLVLTISLGLLAGIYPALAMSGLKPLNIMRGFSTYRISPVLSKSLVVLQYTICIVLVISALVINKQMHFINATSMGFDKDQVVLLQNPYPWNDAQDRKSLKERLTQYVATQPELQGITTTYFDFGGYNTNGYIINGKQFGLQELGIDYNYFSFNKIPIVLGRDFSRDIASDTAYLKLSAAQTTPQSSTANHSVVVNQTLYNLMGKPKLDVINPQIGGIIIGVCKDYHTEDLTKPISPVYHKVTGAVDGWFWIKIKAGQSIPKAMENLHTNWNALTGNMPFSYTFMDQEVAKSYDAYLRWMATITTSCLLAIIIACMGLFGLSGLSTINRTKEIGIRKVLGASISNLFMLLNKGTLLLAAGSFVIAAPIAFYFANQWLDNFAYRVTPDWQLFALAALIAVCTAIVAVSYHTIKAAIANPVKSLRSE